MRHLALALAFLSACARSTPKPQQPGETPVPSESTVRILRSVQSRAGSAQLARMIVGIGASPDLYVEGKANSSAEVNALLGELAKDPHLPRIRCEWSAFQESGSARFGFRAPLHVHGKVATPVEMHRVPTPGLSEIMNSYRTHDREGLLTKMLTTRLLWTTDAGGGWKLTYYDLASVFPEKAVSLDTLLTFLGNIEAHYPTLRVGYLDVRFKDAYVIEVVSRLFVYSPPPLGK